MNMRRSSAPWSRRAVFAALGAVVLVSSPLLGCRDDRPAHEARAAAMAEEAVSLATKQVTIVREGVAAISPKLGALLPETLSDLRLLQAGLTNARRDTFSADTKHTFLSFTNSVGVVLRSETDPDNLGGVNLLTQLPSLRPVLTGEGGGKAEAFADLPALRVAKEGPELAWVASATVRDPAGKPTGLVVSGFTLRALAYHLEVGARAKAAELGKELGAKNAPLAYAFVVRGAAVFGSLGGSTVATKAVENASILDKTTAAPWQGTLLVDGRPYFAAARRLSALGDDVAVAVLWSLV